jgi:iron-sulfur cluster assembly accessory protein
MATAYMTAGLNAKRWKVYMDVMSASAEIAEIPFRLSVAAAGRVAEILAAEPDSEALRVEVLAGGCSGFQYKFDLTATRQPDDLVITAGQATVYVDQASLALLAGAELDYKDSLMGAHFAVKNPNATSACGCGTSFSID